VDNDAERRACLEQVLSINPHNDVARRGLAHLQTGAAVRPSSAASPSTPQAGPAPADRQPSPAGESAFDAARNQAPPIAPPTRAETRRFNWILGLGVALALLALGLALTSALTGGESQESKHVAVEPLYPIPYVVVYGRQSCGLTRQMMQDLDQRDIDYIFKSMDDQPVRDEIFPRMRAAGLDTRSFLLPVVDVSGWLLVHPSISAVVERHNRVLETVTPAQVD
jgi:hypothetical protein